MSEKKIMIQGVLVDIDITYSFVEVCRRVNLSPTELSEWLAHGLLGEQYIDAFETLQFDNKMIDRILTVYRLHYDLQVNLQGSVLVLELLDELKKIEDELTVYKRMGE